MSETPQTKIDRYAILGYPLEHSVSPTLHNRAFQDYGMPAVYEKMVVTPDEFEKRIPEIKKEDWRGFNVTIPYKERILPFLDEIDPTAQAIGAVNTIKCEGERWLGFNTDWLGFLRPLEKDLFRLKHALILGAGGAARAVAFALIVKGRLTSLTLANRTLSRAQKLVEDLRTHTSARLQTFALESLQASNIETFDLIVNTTSVGMNDPANPLILDPLPLAHKQTIVYDLIYKPPQTALVHRAHEAGLKTFNGYPMLVYQAEEAFKIWTGKPYKDSTLQALLSGMF